MKILAFSDLHRDVKAAQGIVAASIEADILIGAGDFAKFGQGAVDTIRILRMGNTPTVLVSGNHDSLMELHNLCFDWENGFLLHGQSVTLGGITFFGLGGEIPQRNDAQWNLAVSEEQASEALAACPSNAVLITHTPPLGYADKQNDGTHHGSRAIVAAIEEKQPVFNFCGHIHPSWGASGNIGKTSVHNLGPSINWFELR